jgi:hypothetical protein
MPIYMPIYMYYIYIYRQHMLYITSSFVLQMLLSPSETRTRDGSLFKVSPGVTTVFSPNRPSLGSSPTSRD